jgi:hypothetical protein
MTKSKYQMNQKMTNRKIFLLIWIYAIHLDFDICHYFGDDHDFSRETFAILGCGNK